MARYVLKDPKKAALLAAWAEAWNIEQGDIQKQISDSMKNEEFVSIYLYALNNADYGNLCSMITMPKRCFSVEYDPNSWNDFPETTPPIGVLMRVEFTEGECEEEQRHYIAAKWDGEKWLYYDDFDIDETMQNIRFRPWEG